MFFLLLGLILMGMIIEFFRKYVLNIKDPSAQDLWKELDEQDWFKHLKADPKIQEWINQEKETGLLKDPYYVRKIIDQEGHREGFIKYMYEKIG